MYEQAVMAGQAERDYGSKVQGEQRGEAHVHRNAERLEKRVQSLADTAARLDERLGSVMRPDVPRPAQGDNAVPVPGSPLASHLATLEFRLVCVEGSLHAIMERLDL